ncbi:MAG: hypothetical protein WA797_02745, partial [Acidimicrobiales bacterium]
MTVVRTGIEDRAIIVGKVVAIAVIDKAVAFVVFPVATNLAGVLPNRVDKIGVRDLDARIDHCDYLARALADRPGIFDTNVCTLDALLAIDGPARV